MTFLLFWDDLLLQNSHVISFVLFIGLGKEESIIEALAKLYNVFGLKRLEVMQKSINKLRRRVVVSRDDF
jgi:hypothetical protein